MTYKIGDKVKIRLFGSEISNSNTYKGVYINLAMKDLMGKEVEFRGYCESSNGKPKTFHCYYQSSIYEFPLECIEQSKYSSEDLLAALAQDGSTVEGTALQPKVEKEIV